MATFTIYTPKLIHDQRRTDISVYPVRVYLSLETFSSSSCSSDENCASFNALPSPWKVCKHPEGGTYFHNNELRLVTMDNMFDPIAREAVLERRHTHIHSLEQSDNLKYLPEDCEMWISFADGFNHVVIHSWREGRCYVPLRNGAYGPSNCLSYSLGYIMQFPTHHESLPPGFENEYVRALSPYGNGIDINNKYPTYPFSDQDAQEAISIYGRLKVAQAEGENIIPKLAFHIAAVLFGIEKSRLETEGATGESDQETEDVSNQLHFLSLH